MAEAILVVLFMVVGFIGCYVMGYFNGAYCTCSLASPRKARYLWLLRAIDSARKVTCYER